MTAQPGEVGAPPPSGQRPRRRAGYKPIVATVVIAGPMLALLVLNAATLLWALVVPTSTCWMKSAIEAGEKHLDPFVVLLLLFVGTSQVWAPAVLMALVLFWYLEWIRMRELAAVGAGYVVVLCGLWFGQGWMAGLYYGQYRLACG